MILTSSSILVVSDVSDLVFSARDTSAPILACPPNQEVEAEKLQTEMRVSWPEPTASDNKDGKIK